jgi:hypothetical protein
MRPSKPWKKIIKEDRAHFADGRIRSTFNSLFDRFLQSLCLSHRKIKTMRVEREVSIVAVLAREGGLVASSKTAKSVKLFTYCGCIS